MESKVFKKVVNNLLISKGFLKKRNYYVNYFEDLVIVIGLQKSNYANGFYINIGYIITKLNLFLDNPRDVDGDVRARFSFEKEGKQIDYFDLEEFLENDYDKINKSIEENIKQYVESVTSLNELKTLINENPIMLYQTKLEAKKILGF